MAGGSQARSEIAITAAKVEAVKLYIQSVNAELISDYKTANATDAVSTRSCAPTSSSYLRVRECGD